MHKGFVLGLLTGETKSQIRLYRRFVAVDEENQLDDVMEHKRWPSLLGPKDFVDWVKATYKEVKDSIEMPQVRELHPETDRIISCVCDYYDVECKKLFISKRGEFNEPRCMAIYLIRRLRRDNLKKIGKVLKLDKYSSISSIIERMKTRIQNNRKIKMRVKKVGRKANKESRADLIII